MKNIVVMFPYPSGSALHIGHYYNYSIVDSYCRYLRYRGENVVQPFGYDAFGLPTENYAKLVGRDPKEIAYENIENFRQQLKKMNTQYEEKLITCDESYQKWTKWIFLKLLENKLAYKKNGFVNYCQKCETVLANEQVKTNKCERCESEIIQKEMNQWYFNITKYKERLISNLDNIDYPKSTINSQRNWLENLHDWCVSRQRKWGCAIPVQNETDTLDTFVDSSFYYLRYLTSSKDVFLEKDNYKPVDIYIGGKEHACMHLIYTRFIHYFLFDIGIVPQEEPFNKVIHQGVITVNGNKMSKSKNNTVNPDDYNADELRMFLMFLGPYFDGGDWNSQGIVGITRFLNRIRGFLSNSSEYGEILPLEIFEKTIFQYTENWKFNKVISSFMEFYNINKNKTIHNETKEKLIEILKMYAPGFNL